MLEAGRLGVAECVEDYPRRVAKETRFAEHHEHADRGVVALGRTQVSSGGRLEHAPRPVKCPPGLDEWLPEFAKEPRGATGTMNPEQSAVSVIPDLGVGGALSANRANRPSWGKPGAKPRIMQPEKVARREADKDDQGQRQQTECDH